MTIYYDTLKPYRILDYKGIQYSTCRDFNHISRYRGLRRVVHSPELIDERFVTLETPNAFITDTDYDYYEVPSYLEDRLDVIAYNKLGNANYAWIIAYANQIEDGFHVTEGQKLRIPRSITQFFKKGEILQSVSPSMLNLGSE